MLLFSSPRDRTIGRGICRVASLFVDLPTLVEEADRRAEERRTALSGAIQISAEDTEDQLTADEKEELKRRQVFFSHSIS